MENKIRSNTWQVPTTKPMPSIINHFRHQIIQNGSQASQILDHLPNNPDHFLIHCYAASFYLYGQTDTATHQAILFLQIAQNNQDQVTQYEQMLYDALWHWSQKKHRAAIEQFTQLLRQYPQDLLVAKYIEWLYYCIGQKYHANPFYDLCKTLIPFHRDNPYFLSVYAFALELKGYQKKPSSSPRKLIN